MSKRKRKRVAPEKFRREQVSYAAAVEAELGRDVAIRLDRLADLAENGGADFAAAEMERIGTDLGLREGCLGRSRIEHQAGVAYRFVLGGARHQTLRKSHDLLERAYACKERKRYPRAWGETALHLAHTYRDIGRELSTAEQQHAWSKSERLLDEALRAFETEGLPGAFHCASTLQSIANLAAERGDTKKARRFNKAARELIEKRVGSLGWDDVTMTNPRGLYACVAANSVTSLQREGTPLSLSQAAKELEHSLLEVDDPRIRFRLAQVYSLQGKVDQANLDSLTSMEVTTVLNTQDLDAVPVLLSEGELTQKVDAFFQGVIAMLARVRGDQRGHDSDHTAARLGHFCRHWAKLLAKNGEPFAAFCAVESNAALRMQEAARFHQWRPRDAEQAALYEEWTVRAELASVFTGWSAKLASMPPALRALFVASVRSQLDPNHPESPGIGDELEGRTLDRLWHEFQRLDGSLTPDEALRRHAETLGDEATEIRMKLETDARFVRAQSSLPPIDEDGLKALLIENKGRALLRLEYFSDEVLGLYGDVDPSGAPRALVYPVSFPAEILGLIDVREMWEHGSISEAALSALSKIDLLGGIPHDGPRNVVLLQSGGMALLPTLAIGPPGATLLDRFDSVQTLWSIAPLRVRPAAMEERSGTLALYPGREIQFDDDKSTVRSALWGPLPARQPRVTTDQSVQLRGRGRGALTARVAPARRCRRSVGLLRLAAMVGWAWRAPARDARVLSGSKLQSHP